MPSRLQRFQDQGSYHFITFSCYHRLPYLADDHSRATFQTLLERYRKRHKFHIFGYVLMPTHVHLLLSEPKDQPLATTLSALKGETSKLLKGERKQFWQTRYYDFNILTQSKFSEKLAYIHSNPVKAGFVAQPEDWPWSSARHWLTGFEGNVEIESEWTWARRERCASPPMPTIEPSS